MPPDSLDDHASTSPGIGLAEVPDLALQEGTDLIVGGSPVPGEIRMADLAHEPFSSSFGVSAGLSGFAWGQKELSPSRSSCRLKR